MLMYFATGSTRITLLGNWRTTLFSLTQRNRASSLAKIPLSIVRFGLVRPVAALVFILLTFFTLGQAQSTNASLAGRITDPANALIVDARVAAISAGTNIRYEDVTNGSGEYHLANLPPASYRLEIQKSGFKKLIKPDVVLIFKRGDLGATRLFRVAHGVEYVHSGQYMAVGPFEYAWP